MDPEAAVDHDRELAAVPEYGTQELSVSAQGGTSGRVGEEGGAEGGEGAIHGVADVGGGLGERGAVEGEVVGGEGAEGAEGAGEEVEGDGGGWEVRVGVGFHEE